MLNFISLGKSCPYSPLMCTSALWSINILSGTHLDIKHDPINVTNTELTALGVIMRWLLRLMSLYIKKKISLVMSCLSHTHTHTPPVSLLGTAAYILRLQRFYHGRFVCPGWVRWGRGESLLPFGQARRAVTGLKEGALQFADVGLVLDHLRRGLGVLQ